MSATNAVNFEKEIPDVFKTMAGATYAVHDLGFDRKLSHLVHIGGLTLGALEPAGASDRRSPRRTRAVGGQPSRTPTCPHRSS